MQLYTKTKNKAVKEMVFWVLRPITLLLYNLLRHLLETPLKTNFSK